MPSTGSNAQHRRQSLAFALAWACARDAAASAAPYNVQAFHHDLGLRRPPHVLSQPTSDALLPLEPASGADQEAVASKPGVCCRLLRPGDSFYIMVTLALVVAFTFAAAAVESFASQIAIDVNSSKLFDVLFAFCV